MSHVVPVVADATVGDANTPVMLRDAATAAARIRRIEYLPLFPLRPGACTPPGARSIFRMSITSGSDVETRAARHLARDGSRAPCRLLARKARRRSSSGCAGSGLHAHRRADR